jgi:GNAT superfamily N-acetyltransferase
MREPCHPRRGKLSYPLAAPCARAVGKIGPNKGAQPVSRDWIVRQVRLEEGLRLRELRLRALACAPKAFGSTLARELAFGPEVWHQRAADGAAGLASITVVAEHKDRLVAMASGLTGGVAEQALGPILVGMFVADDMRGLGIGEALVESIKSWAKSRAHAYLHLWVVSVNTPAIALYRRCSFQASGAERPVAHTPGLIELQMVARLPPPDRKSPAGEP